MLKKNLKEPSGSETLLRWIVVVDYSMPTLSWGCLGLDCDCLSALNPAQTLAEVFAIVLVRSGRLGPWRFWKVPR